MEPEHSALAIAITSGKGGVGKTNITTNLGIALAKSGKRVCILDGDTSLANINILLNLSPTVTLDNYLNGERPLKEVMLDGPRGLQIVPSASGIADCVHFTPEQSTRLVSGLEQLESEFDYLLIDTAAGIGESVLQFIESAQYSVIVISPEPTSLTDAFALVKVLQRRGHQQPVYILVNMSNGYAHSMEVFKRFAHAVNKHIGIKVRYLGYVPLDRGVQAAVSAQYPFILNDPESPAGRCITLLANILLKHFTNKSAPIRKISQFWKEQLENAAQAPLESATETTPTTAAATETGMEPVAAVQVEPEVEPEEGIQAEPKTGHGGALQTAPEPGRAATSPPEPETNIAAEPGTPAEVEPAPGQPVAAGDDDATAIQDIVELAIKALQKNHISRTQAEELLAQLIQHYLTEFGTLPQQAIDLVLQAYDQEQLPEATLSRLRQQLAGAVPTESGEQQSAALATRLQEEIDGLVADASHSKQRLTELAECLRAKYRELYNTDISRALPQVRAISPPGSTPPIAKPGTDDKSALRQSIRFASALDIAQATALDRTK